MFDRLGFDLSSSESFQFYIVNETDFDQSFESNVFEVQGSPYDILSMSAEMITATATTSAPTDVTVPITNTPTGDSRGYTTASQKPHNFGRTAGFFIALIGGIMIFMGAAVFFYRRHCGKKAKRNSPGSDGITGSSPAPATSINIALQQQQQQQQQQSQPIEYYAVKPPQQVQATTEVVTEYYAPNGAGQVSRIQ